MNNKKSFLSGKSFYVALSLSVTMVGAACYFAYTKTADDITGRLESSLSAEMSSNDKEAAELKPDVPKVTKAKSERQEYTATEAMMEDSEAETQAPEPDEDVQGDVDENDGSDNQSEEAAKPEERKLVMPVEGEIINEFSAGELVKSKTTGAWQTHNGIDIEAAIGDAVSAADKGKVSAVDSDPLWGITVTIDHGNGVITRYCNLNDGVTVQVGQDVSSGEEIGAVGETADIETAETSHLHFETLKNGSFVNPMDMM